MGERVTLTAREALSIPVHPVYSATPAEIEYAIDHVVPHQDVLDTAELSIAFNQDQSDAKGEYLLTELETFRRAAQSVPGYSGLLVTGYPFYALRPNGSVVDVPEIDRFLGNLAELTEEDRTNRPEGWICAGCQIINNHPDLKTLCGPCDKVVLKPRDIFKALPDLDFWVVLEDVNDETETAVEDAAHEAGFYQSDIDIYRSLTDTKSVLEALSSGEQPEAHLPVDLHVLSGAYLLRRLKKVPKAIRHESATLPISPRALHVRWEKVDEPYDLLKDLIFSMVEVDVTDDHLISAFAFARKAIAAVLGADGAERLIRRNHPKEDRQLESPELRQILAKRVRSWLSHPSNFGSRGH